MNVVCFHNPNEENGYLSNWYMSDFTWNGIAFSSMEQYMMFQKAVYFRDVDIAKEILSINDVARIKELGRLVSGYRDHAWNGVRSIIVHEGLCAKFLQNDELNEKLKATGDALLAECAVHDQIWGIGLSIKDEARNDPKKWRGQNLLGYALMLVRDQDRKVETIASQMESK